MGKFLNAGQTCVAPDYVLVHKSVRKKLLTYLKRMTEKLYGMQPCKTESTRRSSMKSILIDSVDILISGILLLEENGLESQERLNQQF